MNKALRVPDYLSHILQAIERIERHTEDVDEMGFLASELIQDAVVRNIEIVGEAANNIQKVDAAFAATHNEIPWEVMYAMRSRLAHGYDKVDFEIVWKTIQRDLQVIYFQIKAIADKLN
jgi:uncharacterized protein with HEPN domain